VGSASGDKNATELLTQYDLLSGGLGSSRTGSVEIREPQQDHNEGEKGEPTSEAEADRMVRNECMWRPEISQPILCIPTYCL
jgi:hypothetical protein